ncbi:MAG: carbohydrate kinase [Clostridia bacterium]|nr:carbohydrate kinase [Clostridia bacterium]
MNDITSLGEILIDFTSQGVNGQGQRVFAQNAGGAPANVAVAVARLGGKSAFAGKAGNDMHGRFLKSTLENNGVHCSSLILDDDYFTTLAFVDLKEDGEREFSFARKHGADKMLTKKDIPLDLIKNSKVFHFGSVSLTDEPSRSATLYAAEEARNAGVTVAYDPNYRASLWDSKEKATWEMRQAAQLADLIKISDEEAKLLTGESDCEKAAEKLTANRTKIAVVTLGKDGAYVRTKDGGKFVKGFAVNAVDCTGAGDAFWGGFLLKVCQCSKKPDNIMLDEAAEFALFGNAVASICVERHGAIPSLPTFEEVESRVKVT